MKKTVSYPANYHTHCYLDDGKDSLESYVTRALELGFTSLGFSCHTPVSCQDDDWRTAAGDMQGYFDEIDRLKGLYRDQLVIYTGLEMDYMEVGGEMAGLEYADKLDYTIASVHAMYHEKSGTYLCIDGPVEEFEILLRDNFEGDPKALVAYYFNLEVEMMKKYQFDILGHCDLVKKRNTHNRFFDQDAGWYHHLAGMMLTEACRRSVRVEVNTGGMSRGATDEPYPAQWMLEELVRCGNPLVITADAHTPEHLDYYFDGAVAKIREAGGEHIQVLVDGNWQRMCLA